MSGHSLLHPEMKTVSKSRFAGASSVAEGSVVFLCSVAVDSLGVYERPWAPHWEGSSTAR
jgi:hypothetical protein